jgi:hypothetical protein
MEGRQHRSAEQPAAVVQVVVVQAADMQVADMQVEPLVTAEHTPVVQMELSDHLHDDRATSYR